MKIMKNLWVCMLCLSCGVSTVKAQNVFPQTAKEIQHDHNHEGRLFIGGAMTYWKNKDDHSELFDFCPEVGYLFNDRWGVGLLLGCEHESKTDNQTKTTSNAFKISPFVRYYYIHNGPFNLFFDSGFGLNWSKEKTRQTHCTETRNGFETGIRPGACVDLTEGLCLCMRMGFIGYRNDYFMGEEEKIGDNGFGIRFAPEELMIGLELEF